MATGFAYSRSIVIVKAERHTKKTGKSTFETRYYLSSHEPGELSPMRAMELIREHWGGVENRNHWRRDACMGEDKSRTGNPNILINMALIRSAVLRLVSHAHEGRSLPHIMEDFSANPSRAIELIQAHL